MRRPRPSRRRRISRPRSAPPQNVLAVGSADRRHRVVCAGECGYQRGSQAAPGGSIRRGSNSGPGILERRHSPPSWQPATCAPRPGRGPCGRAVSRRKRLTCWSIGTFTPDHICPSTACLVQHRLGLEVPAFDVSAACSGFMYALSTASQFIATGNAKTALVIGGDTNSRFMNPLDQRVFPLFGDGAGAVILRRGEPRQGLVRYQLGADGGGGAAAGDPRRRDSSTGLRGNASGRAAIRRDGWPQRLQMGRPGALGHRRAGPGRGWADGSRRVAVFAPPGKHSQSSMRRFSSSGFPARRSSITFNATATRRVVRFPLRLTRPFAADASSRAIRC